MDLLALQSDWVDDYCAEDEGLEEHKQEEMDDKSVEDEKMALERFPSSSIYSYLDGPDVPASEATDQPKYISAFPVKVSSTRRCNQARLEVEIDRGTVPQ